MKIVLYPDPRAVRPVALRILRGTGDTTADDVVPISTTLVSEPNVCAALMGTPPR